MGDDPWAYGFEKNRHVLETIAGYLYEQGLIKKPLDVETAFAPNTLKSLEESSALYDERCPT